jgi:pimeloyl-ACP methyl ester carboxylesterase
MANLGESSCFLKINFENMCIRQLLAIIGVILIGFSACKKPSTDNTEKWEGSGVMVFWDDVPQEARPIRLFYFVPAEANQSSPIVLVFHGVERNAIDYRNALISKARAYNFIVVAPEFSEEAFPTNNAYQLGNLFVDGEVPLPGQLNPSEVWTFSLIPKIVDFVKLRVPSKRSDVSFIGHSAGAQFLHRLLLFAPDLQVDKAVVSAAGWYTLPDDSVAFPYGIGATSLQSPTVRQFFARRVLVQVGQLDNDPNAPFLRRNAPSDLQGTNRLERAQYFFERSRQLAQNKQSAFVWSFHPIPGLNHNSSAALSHSADLLFQP